MDPVIVVGAGPVGLALALALARHGVPVTVLDKGPGGRGVRGGPAEDARTLLLHPDSLAFLDRIGCPDVADAGTAWLSWRVLRNRQEVLREALSTGDAGLPVPLGPQRPGAAAEPPPPRQRAGRTQAEPRGPVGDRRRPAALHIAQHQLRHQLAEAFGTVQGAGLVTGVTVDAVEQGPDTVRVHATGPGGGTWWTGSHLVGCDGARSAVRKLLGVRFPGRSATERSLVALVRAELPFPGEGRLHRDPPWRGAGPEVTARPLPEDLWRFDWQLPAGRRAPVPGQGSGQVSPHLAPDELIARLRATLTGWCREVPPYELLHSTEYTSHQRLARTFRRGRVFLAGDAAHLLGAMGVQSVEEGLRDAENLAWKLALAWRRQAGEALLDSYDAERRTAVGTRLRAADQVLPLLRPAGRRQAAMRVVLSGSQRRHLPLLAQGQLGVGRLGAPPVYADSPLAVPNARAMRRGAPLRPGDTDTPAGQLVADVAVTTTEGKRERLHGRLGRGFLVLLVAPGTGVWASKHWLTAGLMPKLGEALGSLPVPGELVVADQYPGAAAHTVLLIRPDGHLVHSMAGCRPDELLAYAETARGGPAELTGPASSAAEAGSGGPEDAVPNGAASGRS